VITPEVLGIGALNLDFIYDVDDIGFLKSADLPLVEGGEIVCEEENLPVLREKLSRFGTLRKISPGGSAANTCSALHRMGFPVALTGVLGYDKEGDFFLKYLQGEDVSSVVRRGRTGMAYIINDTRKDRSIVVFPNSNSNITEGDYDTNLLSQARWIHMTSFVTPQALEVQKRIKDRHKKSARFSIDPGEIYGTMGDALLSLLEGAEVLFLSEKEMDMIFGPDRESAVKRALRLARAVVLNKGKDGATLFTGDSSFDSTVEQVRVMDNTGAGDVLSGVFLGLYIRGVDPGIAINVAAKAASVSTKGLGREAYPVGKEIDRWLRTEGNKKA
jgi:ribokinase